jgi:hypothetical protein
VDDKVAFILGPEDPTPDWSYCAYHRRGVIVEAENPGVSISLDARDITPPFTPGALRGGTHLHVFDGAGKWICFTYEDAVLSIFDRETAEQQINLRGVGVSVPGHAVRVPKGSLRNCDGEYFSVLVTQLHGNPRPGTDQIKRASEEAWVGTDGYLRPDGRRQRRAIAFAGVVVSHTGSAVAELFIVDLPDDLTKTGDAPVQGTETHRPAPPAGCSQRRLTFTADRTYPVSPNGGPVVQLTRNPWGIASAFTWSPDGKQIGCVIDNSIFVTDVATGESRRLTPRSSDEQAPRPEACVFSPDGRSIAYVRPSPDAVGVHNQIFTLTGPF